MENKTRGSCEAEASQKQNNQQSRPSKSIRDLTAHLTHDKNTSTTVPCMFLTNNPLVMTLDVCIGVMNLYFFDPGVGEGPYMPGERCCNKSIFVYCNFTMNHHVGIPWIWRCQTQNPGKQLYRIHISNHQKLRLVKIKKSAIQHFRKSMIESSKFRCKPFGTRWPLAIPFRTAWDPLGTPWVALGHPLDTPLRSLGAVSDPNMVLRSAPVSEHMP